MPGLTFELYSLQGQLIHTFSLDQSTGQKQIGFPYPGGMYIGVLRQGAKILATQKITK